MPFRAFSVLSPHTGADLSRYFHTGQKLVPFAGLRVEGFRGLRFRGLGVQGLGCRVYRVSELYSVDGCGVRKEHVVAFKHGCYDRIDSFW